jgi:hypothetical protein
MAGPAHGPALRKKRYRPLARPRQVSMYGLVTFQAFYLPFAFLFMDIIFGASPIPNLFGIAAGHLWYFFTDLYPRSSGRWGGGPSGGGGARAWGAEGGEPRPGGPGSCARGRAWRCRP